MPSAFLPAALAIYSPAAIKIWKLVQIILAYLVHGKEGERGRRAEVMGGFGFFLHKRRHETPTAADVRGSKYDRLPVLPSVG
jgi:hypothetical protein